MRRTKDNVRVRPDGRSRHDPFSRTSDNLIERLEKFLHSTDREWLSLNWRKYRASLITLSSRRLVLKMWEEGYQYFPTLREIRDDLIKA